MSWQSGTIDPSSTTPASDISKITNDLSRLRAVLGGGSDTDIPVGLKQRDYVNVVTDFGADPTGATFSRTAIVNALNSGARWVHLPMGAYKIDANFSVPNYVTLIGDGYGLSAGTAATRIIKVGDFIGVTVNGASQLQNLSVEGFDGNGSDGILVLGGRSVLRDVSSFGHGRDGIKVGDYAASGANTNLWRLFNVIARSNGRHGVFVAHEGSAGSPNNNAGIVVGLEVTSNGSHGLAVSDTVDNEFYGVCSQLNGGQGVYVGNAAKGNYFAPPYTETNTGGDMLLDTGSARNYVMGFRGGAINDGIVDNGTSNMVLGRYGTVKDMPLHKSPEAFHELRLLEDTTGGTWRMIKEPSTGHAVLELADTGSTADVLIQTAGAGAAGLRFGTGGAHGAIRKVLRNSGTLTFTNIPAGGELEQTLTPSPGMSTNCVVMATPTAALPSGISVAAVYWNGTSVVIRLRNHNGSTTTVSVNFRVVALEVV